MPEGFTPEQLHSLLDQLTKAISTQKVVEYLDERLTVQPTILNTDKGLAAYKMPIPLIIRADAVCFAQVDLITHMGILLLRNRAEFAEAMIRSRKAMQWLTRDPIVRQTILRADAEDPFSIASDRAQELKRRSEVVIEWASRDAFLE